jgi:hypothetical protein
MNEPAAGFNYYVLSFSGIDPDRDSPRGGQVSMA